jgi:hypothetical protein
MAYIRTKYKPCILCKKPVRLFSGGKCRDCWGRSYKPKRQGKVTGIKVMTLGALVKMRDDIVSMITRLKNAYNIEGNLYVNCYTCGCRMTLKNQAQCGHYHSRGVMPLRFDHNRNTRAQCGACNGPKGGMGAVFGHKLSLEIGHAEMERMYTASISWKRGHKVDRFSMIYGIREDLRLFAHLAKEKGYEMNKHEMFWFEKSLN